MMLPQETFAALEAEVAALVSVLLEAFSDPVADDDPVAVAEGLERYIAHVEHISDLSETAGLNGLRQACVLFQQQLTVVASQADALGGGRRDLLEEWPALMIGYLEAPDDTGASEALVVHLQNPVWPAPLSEADAAELCARLTRFNDAEPEIVGVALEGLAEAAEPQMITSLVSSDVEEEELSELPFVETPSSLIIHENLTDSCVGGGQQPGVEDLGAEEASAARFVTEEPSVEEASAARFVTEDLDMEESGVEALGVEQASTEELSEPPFVETPSSLAEEDWSQVDEQASVEQGISEDQPPPAFYTASPDQGGIHESLTDLYVDERESSAEELLAEEVLAEEVDAAEQPGEPLCAETPSLTVEVEAKQPDFPENLPLPDEEESEWEGEPAAHELVELLQAEVLQLEEAAIDMAAIVTRPDSENEARSEALFGYTEYISRLTDAAEAMGFTGLQQACAHLHDNLLELAAQSRPLTGEEHQLIMDWLARVMRYLQALTDRDASQALVDHLQRTDWPNPLPGEEAAALVERLASPTLALPETEGEARPQQASLEDVSLALPEDVNPELLDSLLQELPLQTAEFSAAIQRLVGGEGTLRDVDIAQRVAHTVKGAGNTVGVRGIAHLTHHIEDILLALAKHKTLPNRPLTETLLAAADCLEAMSEALIGLSEPPPQACAVLQAVLDWANRIDRDGVPKIDRAPEEHPEVKWMPADATIVTETSAEESFAGISARVAGPLSEVTEATAAQMDSSAATPMMRVPAPLVDELLRLVGESIILTGQIQERARQALRQARAVQMQHQVFQQLTADLENIVEIRGIASKIDQFAAQGNFDPLELEQYDELNTVTHRLLEVALDSHVLDQEIREDLTVLDHLLVTQGRLHRASQEAVLRTRMVPVQTVVPRLQRSVRQTCRLTDKEVHFTVSGGATLIDSHLLTAIIDPLMHVLRNAVDHGVESPERRQALGKDPVGRIDLSFGREGDTLVVRCQDDGSGLDFAAIRETARRRGLMAADAMPGEAELSALILTPGFSTRTETSQTSGRGIGLDVVHTAVQELKGSSQIRSKTGQGCQMEFRLPVTLIAIHALLVRIQQWRFAISSRGVEQILYSGLGEVRPLGGVMAYYLGDACYELTDLDGLLNLPGDRRAQERHTPALLLVREETGATRAVRVEQVLDSRDLVVKPLGRYFPKLQGVIGATILGDGSVAPVLDLPELLRAPRLHSVAPHLETLASDIASAVPRRRMALVVDDSLSARRALAQAVEDAGLEVCTARDGLEAVALIEKRRPDILLVDLEMPRMNGLELTSHVRTQETTRTLPIIMVTSRSTSKHLQEARTAGVNIYMTKPFIEEELLRNIHSVLSAA